MSLVRFQPKPPKLKNSSVRTEAYFFSGSLETAATSVNAHTTLLKLLVFTKLSFFNTKFQQLDLKNL